MEKIYNVTVKGVVTDGKIEGIDFNGSTTTSSMSPLSNNTWNDYWPTSWPSYYPTYSYSWPTTVYMYQITCPKKGCKTMNWLQLDTITPCTKCSSKLKAVSQTADFEVPIK